MADQAIDLKTGKNIDSMQRRADLEALAGSGGGPHNPDMNERLAKLEGAFEGLKASMDTTRWMVTVSTAITLAGFAFFGAQFIRLDNKIDAISGKLSDEFRAMRAETAAQTSAIANSITAAKQQQPQVILMPAPEPANRK